MRKPAMWFLNRSDTNQAVQSQKQVRSFKKRKCTICVAKTKALISFAVTVKLICVFVFTYADCWVSHEAAQVLLKYMIKNMCIHFYSFLSYRPYTYFKGSPWAIIHLTTIEVELNCLKMPCLCTLLN